MSYDAASFARIGIAIRLPCEKRQLRCDYGAIRISVLDLRILNGRNQANGESQTESQPIVAGISS